MADQNGESRSIPQSGSQHMDPGQGVQGYATALELYLAAGWPSVLPLPRGKKANPPDGYTGWKHADAWPTPEQHQRWAEENPDGNNGCHAGIEPSTGRVLRQRRRTGRPQQERGRRWTSSV